MKRIAAVVMAAFLLAGCATLGGETHDFSGPFVGVTGGSPSDPVAAH